MLRAASGKSENSETPTSEVARAEREDDLGRVRSECDDAMGRRRRGDSFRRATPGSIAADARTETSLQLTAFSFQLFLRLTELEATHTAPLEDGLQR
jgi:hypothetical protein